MGRIRYGMLQSVDGYIADDQGQITLPVPGPELHRHFNDLMRRTSLCIYGRRMWETMRYWGEPDPSRDAVAREFAELWQATPKAVVSTTLTGINDGVQLIRSGTAGAVRDLKARYEGDIEVSGAELAASLGRAGLIDEYQLYVQPVVLGGGRPFFAARFRPRLTLAGTETLPQGVVLLRYLPSR